MSVIPGSNVVGNVNLRTLEESNVNQAYVGWLNDPIVTAFSDNQYRKITLESQREYVRCANLNEDMCLYGVFAKDVHVGCITISGVISPHKRAEIAFVIGERSYWGQGIAKSAISMVCNIAKEQYNLHKLFAGCARPNIASKKALEFNGFSLEGVRKQHLYYGGKWLDQLDFGLFLADIN